MYDQYKTIYGIKFHFNTPFPLQLDLSHEKSDVIGLFRFTWKGMEGDQIFVSVKNPIELIDKFRIPIGPVDFVVRPERLVFLHEGGDFETILSEEWEELSLNYLWKRLHDLHQKYAPEIPFPLKHDSFVETMEFLLKHYTDKTIGKRYKEEYKQYFDDYVLDVSNTPNDFFGSSTYYSFFNKLCQIKDEKSDRQISFPIFEDEFEIFLEHILQKKDGSFVSESSIGETLVNVEFENGVMTFSQNEKVIFRFNEDESQDFLKKFEKYMDNLIQE